MVYMKIPKESKIPKNKYGPYELGSDKHMHHIKSHADSKWRGNYTVPFCLRYMSCANFPGACGACFRHGYWKEKKRSRG